MSFFPKSGSKSIFNWTYIEKAFTKVLCVKIREAKEIYFLSNGAHMVDGDVTFNIKLWYKATHPTSKNANFGFFRLIPQ